MLPRVRSTLPVALALMLALAAPAALAGCHRAPPGGQGSAPAPAAGQVSAAGQAATSAAAPAAAQPAGSAAINAPAAGAAGSAAAPSGAAQAGASAAGNAPTVLFLGDSLTAGHGLPAEEAYPALIAGRLRTAGSPWRVVNAGLSGDTSAGGLSRLDWLLKRRVDVLVLALGANDGLRGQDPEAMRANLTRIIERCKARGITVILAGMQMPSNYGPDYTERFKAVFPQLAERFDLPFIPFLLDGVAMEPDLNQADGIHPNAQGQRIVADTVWRVLKPVLERDAAGN
jgi:acyl-CoA thioesterase I